MNKQELFDAAQYALDELKNAGATGAEVRLGSGQVDEINMDAGEFSLIRTVYDSEIRIRALIGTKKGSSIFNAIDRDSVKKAAEAAVAAAQSSEPDDAEFIADSIGEHDFPKDMGEADLDAMYDRMNELVTDAKSEYPKLDFMQFISQYRASGNFYANSNGTRAFQQRSRYDFGCNFSARDGDAVTSISGVGLYSDTPDTRLYSIGFVRRVLGEMEAQLATVPVQGKFVGTVVMTEECLNELLSSVLGSTVTDSPLITGVSPWKDKLGQQVADPRLNITFDPLDPRIIYTQRVDGNGNLVGRQEIIKDGKLVGFALSQYGARKTGLKRGNATGGGLIVGSGDKTYAEMIANVGDGLFVNRFSGGSPAQNGDFSGVAKNSFLIRDGKIAEAVSETMISGNLFEMLNNVVAISSETMQDGGCVLPWIAFGGVTVSGK